MSLTYEPPKFREDFGPGSIVSSVAAEHHQRIRSRGRGERTVERGDDVQVIPSACRQRDGRCALFGHVKDGRLVKVEGNPDLFSEGTLCGRAFAIPQELYNPTRIRYPQKRVGERGAGQWKRITWEEAYETARDEYTKIGEEYGWHTIAHQYGTGRDNHQFQAINRGGSSWGYGTLRRGQPVLARLLLHIAAPLRRRDAVHRLGRQQRRLHPASGAARNAAAATTTGSP